MFKLFFSRLFLRKEKKLTQKNIVLRKKVDTALELLSENPQNPILKSHKIVRRNGEYAISSSVSGDIRIIWEYRKNEAFILDILDIGGHSGSKKVYN